MPGQNALILRRIRTLSATVLAETSDADLVARFVRQRDEAAFEALLRRHGPMIMRLCRRLLPGEQDAEDVFQATFLVLARRASCVTKLASVGPWLYGVASRLSRKSLSKSSRRERIKPAIVVPPTEDLLDRLSVREAERLLHEELARLPARYRDPLVLCHLEGKPRDEAARVLSCPLGTLKDRLMRGKRILHARLTKRGVSLSAALSASLFAETVSNANVRNSLVQSTLQAALAPTRQLSNSIALLVEVGTRSLAVGRMKLVAGFLAASVMIGFAAGLSNFVSASPAEKSDVKTVAKDPPAPEVRQVADGKHVDLLGDPLPKGAVARLGTRRHRVQTWPMLWQSLPDGKSYLSLQRTGLAVEVRRIDAKTGVAIEVWNLNERSEPVAFSPDGHYLLLSNRFIHYSGLRIAGQKEPEQEWQLTLFDLTERKKVWCQREMLAQSNWIDVSDCRFSPDGKRLATGGRHGHGSIHVRDVATGTHLWQLSDKPQSFHLIGFPDGGKLLALRGQNDGDIHLHDAETGKKVRSFVTATIKEYPQGALLSPDGMHFVLGGWKPLPRAWNLEGKEHPPLEGHEKWARERAFSPDSKKLYTGGNDDYILEREWPSGKVIRKIELGRSGVEEMAVSGDGKQLEIIFWGEQALAFFDLETGKRLPEALEAHRGSVYGVETAPDGSLVTFARDSSVRTWDLRSRQVVGQFRVELDLNAGGFALSHDGKRVAVPKEDIKGIHLYERATGKLLRMIPADHWSMRQLEFSPDDRFLSAVDGSSGTAAVWEADTGKQVHRFKAKQVAYGVSGAFSPDGRTFAFSDQGIVRLWDTTSWKEQQGFAGYAPLGLAYSPDGRILAMASVEGVRLYEVGTRRERSHVRPKSYPSGSLRFSGSGRFLAWISDRSKVNVLDVWTGELKGPFTGHDDTVSGLAFPKDERSLASSSSDSTILLWDLTGPTSDKPAKKLDVDRAWQELSSDDAKVSFTALRNLAAHPEIAVSFLKDRLQPAKSLDEKWVAARLRDLDSPKFAVRDRATVELERAGEGVVPFLKQFLKKSPSTESSDRAKRVLAMVLGTTDSGTYARYHRAQEVLEWIGSDAARKVVEKLAAGAPGTIRTEAAEDTLKRWRR